MADTPFLLLPPELQRLEKESTELKSQNANTEQQMGEEMAELRKALEHEKEKKEAVEAGM